MRRWREILITVAIIGGLAAYLVGSEIHYARSISPNGVATVQNFFERFGEPQRIRMVERDGKSYYEFTGQSPGSWSAAVPSSRPVYVFDEQGRFVTWCPDPGDAPSFRRAWPLQSTNPVKVGVVRHKFGL